VCFLYSCPAGSGWEKYLTYLAFGLQSPISLLNERCWEVLTCLLDQIWIGNVWWPTHVLSCFLVFCNTIFPFWYLIRFARCFLYSFVTGSACEEVVGLNVYGGSEFILSILSLGGQQNLLDFRLPCCSKIITFLHNRVWFWNFHFGILVSCGLILIPLCD
jgi:hypothetical protein